MLISIRRMSSQRIQSMLKMRRASILEAIFLHGIQAKGAVGRPSHQVMDMECRPSSPHALPRSNRR